MTRLGHPVRYCLPFDLESSADESKGTTGGSHLLNGIIQELIMPQLRELSADITEGQVASIMQDFETKKRKYNFIRSRKGLRLQGSEPWVCAKLKAEDLYDAFMQAFGKGLRILEKQVSSLIKLKKDLVVIFSGGSFCGSSIWIKVNAIMEKAKKDGQREGVDIRYGRLVNFDPDFW